MIEIKSKLRKWGNSFGIIVPQNLVKGNLKENEDITIFISQEKSDLKEIFGKLKNWRINTQKFKDQIRREELA